MTVPQQDFARFLGKKNFKGLYTKNPLARTPSYHKFRRETAFLGSYPVTDRQRMGARMTDWSKVFDDRNVQETRQPFPQNPLTRTNRRVGEKLREAILADRNAGRTVQELSFKYGIVVPRIDAIIRLTEVREKMRESNSLSKDLQKLRKTMESLFDEIPTDDNGQPIRSAKDNLTEIPIPEETHRQIFQSIAESQPFGPVDAAEVLGIEPATDTLKRLTEPQEEQSGTQDKASKSSVSFFGPQYENEQNLWRFTNAKVGRVGYHYGAAKDDRKHGRRVKFNPDGTQTWPLPEHSE